MNARPPECPPERLRLLPLDARPVCLDFPGRLAQAAGVYLKTPPAALLGALKRPADCDALADWLRQDATAPIILALDTLAYGGLIPSRVGDESIETLQARVTVGLEAAQGADIWAFSSILRIPNYDNAEEEPPYWAQFGRALYAYSQAAHHQDVMAMERAASLIAPDALRDFLGRRERNFTLNRRYLDALASGGLQSLTFCQDDTGSHGLNVKEAQTLQDMAQARGLSDCARVQTGADELAATLLAQWLHKRRAEPLRVRVLYSAESGGALMAKFDGLPIAEVVSRQLTACGAVQTHDPTTADLTLMVHTPAQRMGDWCEDLAPDATLSQYQTVLEACRSAFSAGERLILADVACANGADDALTVRLLNAFTDLTPLYGYAGWNTPGNTIGSALAMGVIRTLAESTGDYRAEDFHRLLLIRLADDWLYQAHVRASFRRVMRIRQDAPTVSPDVAALNALMSDGLALIKTRLGMGGVAVRVGFPCQRTFEVEIEPL